MMERSLTFAGSEVKHAWGIGAHSGFHATAIYPDALRWLWKDYPKPVTTSPSKNTMLADLLIPNESWEMIGQGYDKVDGITVNNKGELRFNDIGHLKIYKIMPNGTPEIIPINPTESIGNIKIADANNRVIARNGNEYKARGNMIFLSKPETKKKLTVVDTNFKHPGGITLVPDETQLYVADAASHWLWLYQIQPNGSLAFKQRYGWLYQSDDEDNAGVKSIKCDTAGRIYAATSMGIQILDQAGRVNAILQPPTGKASNLCFGGENFNVLYVLSGDKLYRRKLNTRGVNAFDVPIKPGKPRM
jgi:gluconolactonase